MPVPHPIPYQGSKRNLATQIITYFPSKIDRLVEPFAGSAALTLAAASADKSGQFLINDCNAPLMQLWHTIIHYPGRIAKYYQHLWEAQQGRERAYYDLVRQRFNQTQQPYYFLYLLARCVKASIRYNNQGEFNQSPDNRRKGRNPKTMTRDILAASAVLKGKTRVMAQDYRVVLEQVAAADLVYLDPPYQGVSQKRDSRYIRGIQFDVFINDLHRLNIRHIPYILSYDGRTGQKSFGETLPASLELKRIELNAGRSSQATLLGRQDTTYESLYLSPALVEHLPNLEQPQQLPLFPKLA